MAMGNFGELLASMSQVQKEMEESVKPAQADPLAQAMELRQRYTTRAENSAKERDDESPVPGDLVEELPGLGRFIDGTVLMLWRWLEPDDDQQDGQLVEEFIERYPTASGDRYDCLVALMLPDNGVVQFQPYAQSMLRRSTRQDLVGV